MSVTATACASGVRPDAPRRVHARSRRVHIAAPAPARGSARVSERVSSVATKRHGGARGGSALAPCVTAGRGEPLRGARVPAARASAADAGCEPPRRTDDTTRAVDGNAGSPREGGDSGEVAGAAPRRRPTGKSALVRDFTLKLVPSRAALNPTTHDAAEAAVMARDAAAVQWWSSHPTDWMATGAGWL